MYLIVLIPVFNKTYKQKKQVKNTCEIYITNWYYSYKFGFFRYVPENEIEGDILDWTPSVETMSPMKISKRYSDHTKIFFVILIVPSHAYRNIA